MKVTVLFNNNKQLGAAHGSTPAGSEPITSSANTIRYIRYDRRV